MEIKSVYTETEDRMQKTVDAIGREFAGIRTGKATPSLVEGIKVDYYGNMTPLSQVASITIPDPKLLVIQPWEKRLIPEIAKAVQKSDLGLNPLTDANVVRLPIPPLTEERRKDLVKLVKKISEEGKIAVRNIRRESNDRFKKAEKEKEISEDNSRKAQERIQEITDDFIQAIDDLVKKKEEEIMEI
ncbi:ribosome recycling factor [candidate division WOR-1 bacterium DG_54_3]|uniref:Ribosome-recycling factor n=1 Tax=candidate division WOR-1 bacterium DG_54_3 TaxID=1703775 RepID=A0A0S7Y1M2_UNCSA|nr:MAG: ribosome recycling factor [candidate division WOR-1 bacterium DG_54_3]